jgi:CHAD domain-containing protein
VVEQTARLREHEEGVRAGRPESVHRLRIAARRLRSALSTFRPVLDRDRTDPVQEELRWLGQALAPARDALVLREHLRLLVAAEPAELVVGSATRRVDDQLNADHQDGLERAHVALDTERYVHLLGVLDGLVIDPPLRRRADQAARKVLPRLLGRDLARLDRAVRAIEVTEDGAGRDAAFHEARKKAKRLRYAAEVAVPSLGKRARSLASSTKKIQRVLGEHQDSVAARSRLRELGMQAHLAGENAFTIGRLHALEQARAERAEADFDRMWSTFTGKQGRRRVR